MNYKLCKESLTLLYSILILLLISACGIEGTGLDGPAPEDEPSSPPIFASGPIDGFGSVIVNGVRYDTSEALININEELSTEDVLSLGQVVLITGTIDADETTGTAQRVDFIANIRGPVSNVNPVTNTITVLEQVIALNNETQLDDTIDFNNLATLSNGEYVEVSGLPTSNGTLIATRVDRILPIDAAAIIGMISNIDTQNLQFNLNELRVDYSQAVIITADNADLTNDTRVLVQGNLNAQGIFIASRISTEALLPPLPLGTALDIEAIISRFESASDFELAGINVTTTEQTRYINGLVSELGLNRAVNVKGELSEDNILVAETIEFIVLDIDIQITAAVESISHQRDEGQLAIVQLLGLDIVVGIGTQFKNTSSEQSPFNNINELQLGDYVDIRAFFDGDRIISSQITRITPSSKIRLRSIVTTVSDIFLVIHGITVQLSTNTEFVDIRNNTLSRSAFLAQASGMSALVEGEYNNEVIQADRIQLIPNGSVLVGTQSRDALIGSDNDDQLFGGDGNDTIIGGGGNDELYGEAGNDVIYGDADDDKLFGGAGRDQLFPGSGQDVVDGGESDDRVSYASSNAAITISLADGTASGGDAESDILINIEHISGTDFNDHIAGNDDRNRLKGELGNDILIGLGGSDTLAGGDGNDELHGGDMNDRLVGGNGDDQLFGGSGDDRFEPGDGADIIDGGDNEDSVSYSDSEASVIVSLTPADMPASGGHAEGDTYVNVENIEGSPFDDQLTGNQQANDIQGGNGDDQLYGLAGDDQLEGNSGHDTIYGGNGDDMLIAGDGDDQLFGDAGDDKLWPGEGINIINGGPHDFQDAVIYTNSPAGVHIILDGAAGSGGDAEGDIIIDIENAQGSQFNDTLHGNAQENLLLGHNGDDQLAGFAGNDLLEGGLGSDRYMMDVGFNHDTLKEEIDDNTSIDVIFFAAGITPQNLWFTRRGNHLQVHIISTDASIRVLNWYSEGPGIERFEAGGQVLLASDVQILVDSMIIAIPVTEQLFTVSSDILNQVIDEINTSWN